MPTRFGCDPIAPDIRMGVMYVVCQGGHGAAFDVMILWIVTYDCLSPSDPQSFQVSLSGLQDHPIQPTLVGVPETGLLGFVFGVLRAPLFAGKTGAAATMTVVRRCCTCGCFVGGDRPKLTADSGKHWGARPRTDCNFE